MTDDLDALRAENEKLLKRIEDWLDKGDWQKTDGRYSWKNNQCKHGQREDL